MGPTAEVITAYVLSGYIPFIHDVPDAALTCPIQRRFFAPLLDALTEPRRRQAERHIGEFTPTPSWALNSGYG
jgi:hypothetical protein